MSSLPGNLMLVIALAHLVGVLLGAGLMRAFWRPRCLVCQAVTALRSLPPPRYIDQTRESFSNWPFPIEKKKDKE